MLAQLPQSTFAPTSQAGASAPAPSTEEEETLLVSSGGHPSASPTDEDETIVNTPSSPLTQKPEQVSVQPAKPARFKRVAVLLIGFVALVSAAFAIFWQQEAVEIHPENSSLQAETLPTESPATPSKEEEEPTLTEEMTAETADKEDIAQTNKPETTAVTAKPTTQTGPQQEAKRPTTTPAKPLDSRPKPASMNVESRYQALLQSGKAKLAKADFAGAKADLTQAKEAKITEEVVRLLIQCDESVERQQIADRIAQYEEKMAFGPYKIVRKKSNNKYGAIDTKGQERIPCKYLSVGIAEQGRAFERPDNLFDIYNTDGKLVGEGLSYY